MFHTAQCIRLVKYSNNLKDGTDEAKKKKQISKSDSHWGYAHPDEQLRLLRRNRTDNRISLCSSDWRMS